MAAGVRINYIRIPAVCFWMHIVLVSIRFYAKYRNEQKSARFHIVTYIIKANANSNCSKIKVIKMLPDSITRQHFF